MNRGHCQISGFEKQSLYVTVVPSGFLTLPQQALPISALGMSGGPKNSHLMLGLKALIVPPVQISAAAQAAQQYHTKASTLESIKPAWVQINLLKHDQTAHQFPFKVLFV